MHLTLKHDAVCADCGAALPAGTRARWFRDGSVYGSACHRWQIAGITTAQETALRRAAQAVLKAARGREVPEGPAARLAALKASCGQQITRQTYQWLIAELRSVRKEIENAQTT